MWDALGNNQLLFSYFFYYRLRYIYKISNDNLQVDFDEGTIPLASAPAISCYDFFAQRPRTQVHIHTHICTRNNRTWRSGVYITERTPHTNAPFFCVLSRAFLFIDWQFQRLPTCRKHPFILRHCYEFRVWNAIRCCADCSACWMYIIFIHLQPFLLWSWSAFFFSSFCISHTWASCVKPSRFNP